jgi:hypothetical protein
LIILKRNITERHKELDEQYRKLIYQSEKWHITDRLSAIMKKKLNKTDENKRLTEFILFSIKKSEVNKQNDVKVMSTNIEIAMNRLECQRKIIKYQKVN